MKYLLLLSLTTFFSFLFNTTKVNELKKTARQFYAEKKYLEAIKIYTQLENEYHVKEPRLIYNHANACYRSLQLTQAFKYYGIIAEGEDSLLSSQALNQLGIICCRTHKLKEGKDLFIQALRKNPANTHAVLNLEWALKQKEIPTEQSANKKQQAQQGQGGQNNAGGSQGNKTDPEGENEEDDALKTPAHKNKYMDIHKARLLLESMKNSEKQYIQQLPVNTTSNTKDPAW